MVSKLIEIHCCGARREGWQNEIGKQLVSCMKTKQLQDGARGEGMEAEGTMENCFNVNQEERMEDTLEVEIPAKRRNAN